MISDKFISDKISWKRYEGKRKGKMAEPFNCQRRRKEGKENINKGKYVEVGIVDLWYVITKKKYKISNILMSIVIKRSIMVHVLMKIVSKASK
jgi:hypothetical protein